MLMATCCLVTQLGNVEVQLWCKRQALASLAACCTTADASQHCLAQVQQE